MLKTLKLYLKIVPYKHVSFITLFFKIFKYKSNYLKLDIKISKKHSLFIVRTGVLFGVLRDSCCSAYQSCLTLCDPMGCSTPGFPVLHYIPEFAETCIHWADDAIQLSHPLLPPFPKGFCPNDFVLNVKCLLNLSSELLDSNSQSYRC